LILRYFFYSQNNMKCEKKVLFLFPWIVLFFMGFGGNPGEVEDKLAKVERDFLVLDARLIWDISWKGGRIPLPDYLFLLSPGLQEAMRIEYHLLNYPKTIEKHDYREFNRRICHLLTKDEAMMHDFRTIFHFRKDLVTTNSQELLIEKYCTDPFKKQGLYDYFGMITINGYQIYILKSNGPDFDSDLDFLDLKWENGDWEHPKSLVEYWYDPTNGVVSDGDMFDMFEEVVNDISLKPEGFLETPFGKKIMQNRNKTLRGSNDEFWEAIGHPPQK
jgi:hypothetical protein